MALLGSKDSRKRYRRVVGEWSTARIRKFLREHNSSNVKRQAKGIAWAERISRRG